MFLFYRVWAIDGPVGVICACSTGSQNQYNDNGFFRQQNDDESLFRQTEKPDKELNKSEFDQWSDGGVSGCEDRLL